MGVISVRFGAQLSYGFGAVAGPLRLVATIAYGQGHTDVKVCSLGEPTMPWSQPPQHCSSSLAPSHSSAGSKRCPCGHPMKPSQRCGPGAHPAVAVPRPSCDGWAEPFFTKTPPQAPLLHHSPPWQRVLRASFTVPAAPSLSVFYALDVLSWPPICVTFKSCQPCVSLQTTGKNSSGKKRNKGKGLDFRVKVLIKAGWTPGPCWTFLDAPCWTVTLAKCA